MAALGLLGGEGAARQRAAAPWEGEGRGAPPPGAPMRALGRVRGALPAMGAVLLEVAQGLHRGRVAAAGGGGGPLLLVDATLGPAGAHLLHSLGPGDWCLVLGDVADEEPSWDRVPKGLRPPDAGGDAQQGPPARLLARVLRCANGLDVGLYIRAAACARGHASDLAEPDLVRKWAARGHHVLTSAAEVRAAVLGGTEHPLGAFLVELAGTVVDMELKLHGRGGGFRAWTLDDGMATGRRDGDGLMICMLWKENAPGGNLEATPLRVGDIVRVRGKASVFRGYPQVQVFQLCREPPLTETTAEAKHWVQVHLARRGVLVGVPGAVKGKQGS